jgi:hypothetical protein
MVYCYFDRGMIEAVDSSVVGAGVHALRTRTMLVEVEKPLNIVEQKPQIRMTNDLTIEHQAPEDTWIPNYCDPTKHPETRRR